MSKAKTKLLNVVDYVSIDIETTGLDTSWCEIIELAAIAVKDGATVGTFQELVKPDELPIPEFIENLTGITSAMLENARTIDDVLPDFLTFVGNKPVVGQNVTFDIRFIDSYAQDMGFGEFKPNACDTMRISRVLFPEMQHHRLKDNVEQCARIASGKPEFGDAHRALADAEMTSWCYEVMRPILVERYGEDPEHEIAAARLAAKSSASYKDFLSKLTPTVEDIDEDNPFFGANVCFTGTLSTMTRKVAWQHAVNLGATPQQSVTKKTDYLVVGSLDFSANLKGDKSSKLKKAETLLAKNGAPEIVSEGFFTQFIDEG